MIQNEILIAYALGVASTFISFISGILFFRRLGSMVFEGIFNSRIFLQQIEKGIKSKFFISLMNEIIPPLYQKYCVENKAKI